MSRTYSSEYEETFLQNMRKRFFTVRVTEHWDGLSIGFNEVAGMWGEILRG